jgi:hypothetical protein
VQEDDPVTVFDTTTGLFVQARAGLFVHETVRWRLLGGRFDWAWAWVGRRRIRMLLPNTEGVLWARGWDEETAAALRAAKKLADTARSSS